MNLQDRAREALKADQAAKATAERERESQDRQRRELALKEHISEWATRLSLIVHDLKVEYVKSYEITLGGYGGQETIPTHARATFMCDGVRFAAYGIGWKPDGHRIVVLGVPMVRNIVSMADIGSALEGLSHERTLRINLLKRYLAAWATDLDVTAADLDVNFVASDSIPAIEQMKPSWAEASFRCEGAEFYARLEGVRLVVKAKDADGPVISQRADFDRARHHSG